MNAYHKVKEFQPHENILHGLGHTNMVTYTRFYLVFGFNLNEFMKLNRVNIHINHDNEMKPSHFYNVVPASINACRFVSNQIRYLVFVSGSRLILVAVDVKSR